VIIPNGLTVKDIQLFAVPIPTNAVQLVQMLLNARELRRNVWKLHQKPALSVKIKMIAI
jgi:hypothetical protein